jgi:hypothetical protein
MRRHEKRNRNPRNEFCHSRCLSLRLIIQWRCSRCKSITFPMRDCDRASRYDERAVRRFNHSVEWFDPNHQLRLYSVRESARAFERSSRANAQTVFP